MSNRQIQPVRPREVQVIRQGRSRSLWGQVWSVALQPNNFFLALPQTSGSSRQWFWVAVLILALNGFSAVRQEALASSTGSPNGDLSAQSNPGDFSGGSGGTFAIAPGGGGGIAVQPGGFPGGSTPDLGSGIPTDTGSSSSNTASTWVTALISATTILAGWFVLAVILCEVPLFNGVRPSFGQNLQIAIWTTVPLGVMAGLQVIFLAAGGTVGASGISGLLTYWKGYNDLSPLIRSIVLSLTSRLTLFWLWTLVLIYIGGRQALNGKSWAVGLVVVIWVLILVLVPVFSGAISAPTVTNSELPEPIMLPSESDIMPESTLGDSDSFTTPMPSGDSQVDTTRSPSEGGEREPSTEGASTLSTSNAPTQAQPTPSKG